LATAINATTNVNTSYYCYPFGQVLSVSTSGDHHRYIGKELDDGYNIDLYYFGARYYDASLGRFISPDPIRWYLNPYSYAGDEPITCIDIWGLGDRDIWVIRGKQIGGAIGAAAALALNGEREGRYVSDEDFLNSVGNELVNGGETAGGAIGGAAYDVTHPRSGYEGTGYNTSGGAGPNSPDATSTYTPLGP
jgi:RHS repeat-associated protein